MVDFNSDSLSGGNKESLTFPRDMTGGKVTFYPEAIRFGIFHQQGPSYKKVKEDAGKAVKKIKAIGSDGDDALTFQINENNNRLENFKGPTEKRKELADSVAAENRGLLAERTKQQSSDALSSGKEVLETLSSEFEQRKPTLEKTIQQHIQSIYLNMPTSLAYNEAVQWQGTDMGIIGAFSAGGMAGGLESGMLSNMGSVLGGAAGMAANLLPGLSGAAAPIVGAVLGSGSLQSGIESTFNVKANPYKEQTFDGVDFRTFDFSFVFRARSQDDVNMIQKIITSFRAHSKPTYEGDQGQTGVFNYPKEFAIEFLTLDDNDSYITNPYLPELKMCVCTGVNTNFAQSGWRSFEGGAPVDISLQLTFSETEIITGEDVLGETKAGRFKDTKRRF